MSNPTVVYFGASRGVSFAAYTYLAERRPDIHHVLAVRSISRFQSTEEYNSLSADLLARTTLFEGDAHTPENVRDALRAGGDNMIGIVSSIGWRPPSDLIPAVKGLLKGIQPDPADICSRALRILLSELSAIYPSLTVKPKLVLCSSMGMGKRAHNALAFGLGTTYDILIKAPHEDKIAMEVALQKLMLPPPPSWPKPTFFPSEDEALPHILSASQLASLPAPFLPQTDVCVVRPAFMTDGPRTGWVELKEKEFEDGEKKCPFKKTKGYRVIQEGDGPNESKGKKMYSVSRSDVGDFMASMLAGVGEDDGEVDQWWGCQPVLAY